METLIVSLISLFIGIISSYISWWILFKIIVPKIKFSDKISKIPSESSKGFGYRVKYHNCGRRNIIDITINIRLRIKGLFKDRKMTWKVIYLETEPEMKAKPLIKPSKEGGNLVYINVNDTKYFSNPIFPIAIRDKHNKRELLLEDILKLGDERKLEIILSGYDEFSGARKVFISKSYYIDDIVTAKFLEKSLEIDYTKK